MSILICDERCFKCSANDVCPEKERLQEKKEQEFIDQLKSIKKESQARMLAEMEKMETRLEKKFSKNSL